ncbi:MAG: class I SAM-dependent methyltransferase, partial [Bacteroidetes bacterium]|nr:class I SAM-dependent methyltransferase [Bacteroidota bacterium]
MDPYQITFQTWNKVSSLYQDKFMNLDLYDDTYDLFCKYITQAEAKIFEIGCGPGNITKYLLSKRPDFKIEAIDVAPNMIFLARKNNPAASFKIMDCRELDAITEKYNGVMCGFCMPYLSKEDCGKLIKDTAAIMNQGGIFYFSVLEGDYLQSGYEAGSSGDKAYVYY